MKRHSFSFKLILSFLLIGLISISLIGMVSYFIAKNELKRKSFEKLQIITSNKKTQIEQYFNERLSDVELLSKLKITVDMVSKFDDYKSQIGLDDNEPFFTSNDDWTEIFETYSPEFQNILSQNNYFDILIVNKSGQVVFSALKKNVLGENLVTGRLKTTYLADIFHKTKKTGKTQVSDFQRFSPANNKIYSFIAAPIFDSEKKYQATIVLQFVASNLNKILENSFSENSTGEIFIAGSDYLIRGSSVILDENNLLRDKFKNKCIDDALAGNNGNDEIEYQNIDSYISYNTLAIGNLKWVLVSKVDTSEVQSEISTLAYTIFFVALVLLVGIFLIGFFITKGLYKPIKDIKETLQSLRKGIPRTQKISYKGDGEFQEITKVVNELSEGLRNTAFFAKDLGSKHFDGSFQPLSDEDVLGNSLLSMKKSLIEAQKEEEKRLKDDHLRNWANEGYAKFVEILREHPDNINLLADDIIQNIVHYLNANQAGLFIYNDDSLQDIHLELLASYAYNRKKFQNKRIKIGEGLIGTCAMEKTTLYMNELPQDYIEINSGLGDATPSCLLLIPLKQDENFMGIIEIASFNEIQPHEIAFLERIGESIASTLSGAKINNRTAILLDETRKQAEEMTSQEEEMRQNLEEMQATREEAMRKEQEMTSILSAVDNTLIRAELDYNGTFLNVNEQFLTQFAYTERELNSALAKIVLTNNQPSEFDKIWKTINAGNTYYGALNTRKKTGETIWLLASFTPILNEEQELDKIIFLGNNITDQKNAEDEIRRQTEMLKVQEDILKTNLQDMQRVQRAMKQKEIESDSLIKVVDYVGLRAECSLDGKFITANDNFLSTFGYISGQLQTLHLSDFLVEAENANFYQRWQNVCNGNYEQLIVAHKDKKEEDIWLLTYLNPVFNASKEMDRVIIFLLDVTEQKKNEAEITEKQDRLQRQEEILKKTLKKMQDKQTALAEQVKIEQEKNQELEEQHKKVITDLETIIKNKEISKTSLPTVVYTQKTLNVYKQWLDSLDLI